MSRRRYTAQEQREMEAQREADRAKQASTRQVAREKQIVVAALHSMGCKERLQYQQPRPAGGVITKISAGVSQLMMRYFWYLRTHNPQQARNLLAVLDQALEIAKYVTATKLPADERERLTMRVQELRRQAWQLTVADASVRVPASKQEDTDDEPW